MLELGGNQQVAAAIAAVLPLLISLLKNVKWSTATKMWVSVVVSIVVALIVSAFGDKPFWTNVAYNIPIVVAVAQTTYAVVWQNIKPLETKLENTTLLK